MDKSSARNELKIRRSALHKIYVLKKSRFLSKRLSALLRKKRVVASYLPYNNEINPKFYTSLSFCYPKVSEKNMYMCVPKTGFIKGYKGIKEPFGRYIKTPAKKIDAVVVPGIAFDKRGYRVGYGMGFYDKFLEHYKGIKIGVTFDCCIVDKIDNDKHDVAMDFIVTEKKNIICKLRR